MSSLISKLAANNAMIKPYKNEFSKEYYLLIFIKIVISIFSVATSFIFVKNFCNTLIPVEVVSIFLAVIGLIAIEGGAFFTSTKFFKYLWRLHFVNAVIFFPLFVSAFAISFVLSTSGLEELGAATVDNTTEIDSSYTNEVEAINNYYADRISRLDSSIAKIVAPKWESLKKSDGTYNYTTTQQKSLTNLDLKIDLLKEQQKAEIKELKQDNKELIKGNKQEQTTTGIRYFWVIGIALILQGIASLIIGRMSATIYLFDNTKDYIKEDVQTLKASLMEQSKIEILETAKAVNAHVLEAFSVSRLMLEEQTENVQYQVLNKMTNEARNEPLQEVGDYVDKEREIKPLTVQEQQQNDKNKAEEKDKGKSKRIGFHQQPDNEEPENKKPENKKDYGEDTCKNCGEVFKKRTHNNIFCVTDCSDEYHLNKSGFNAKKRREHINKP